jgi:hypothetical protein
MKKKMRKDNKVLLEISIILLIVGFILSVYPVTWTETTAYGTATYTENRYKILGGLIEFVGFLILLASIGRERARRY